MICLLYIYYTQSDFQFSVQHNSCLLWFFINSRSDWFSLIRVVIGSRRSYFLDKRIKSKTNSESLTHFARPTVFVRHYLNASLDCLLPCDSPASDNFGFRMKTLKQKSSSVIVTYGTSLIGQIYILTLIFKYNK